jgi:hypothetical protein
MALSAKRRRRLADKQARDFTELVGGRAQPNSGSIAGYKSDGRVFDKFRIEAKYTQANAFKLELSDLFKIAGECEGSERPVVVVDFKDKRTTKLRGRFVVLRADDFERMANALADDSGSESTD